MVFQEDQSQQMDRDSLERLASMRVCACLYYDLADAISETSDQELIDIINHRYICDMCGMRGEL